ncbi:MAG TPA: AsmA family protein [Candidatus Acidoferrales bacterium]|nr:AsmA family protein [Candidatus Acidoferrales bacterium]
MRQPTRWLLGAAAAVALVAVADTAASVYVRSARATRVLTRRLEAAFGRPVEVGRYGFTFWRGTRIEAEEVTVGEDPRFGSEYFLRAQSVTATLRWRSLVRGKIEFATFSFSQPSLNVVSVGGRWNLADWLPPASPGAAGPGSQTPLLYRIEVDRGRINFKRGEDKLPFALVDVRGSIDERAPGRWAIALQARPMRVAVNLQDAGILTLAGDVGGTSARLRPANLQLHWPDASLGDVLRLARGYDYGVRGRQDLDLRASSTGGVWRFELAARARDLHRWDMVSHPGDPALNLRLAATWQPGTGRWEWEGGRIEGAESLVGVSGEAEWPAGPPRAMPVDDRGPRMSLQLSSAGVGAADLLAWYRAFRPGVSPGLHASGWLQGSLELSGWPPRITRGTLSAAGLRLEGAALPAPIALAAASAEVFRNRAKGSLTGLDFGSKVGAFDMEGSARRDRRWKFQMAARGATPQIVDLVAATKALGANPPAYWNQFSGPADLQIACVGGLSPFERSFHESVEFHDATWREESLPARAVLSDVRLDASASRLRMEVRHAQALGAHWSGWLERPAPAGTWRFSLSADRLDIRPLAARLRTQPRQLGLLERIFRSGRAAGSPPSWLASFEASGRLEARELTAAPLALERVDGRLAIRHNALELSEARARLAGGDVRGGFVISVLDRTPVWHVTARIANADLARLTHALGGTAERRFSGLASATMDLGARGATAAALRDSVYGTAQVAIRGATDRQVDWLATLRAGRATAGRSSFASVTARVRLAGGKLTFRDLRLSGEGGRVQATGGIDFKGASGAVLAVEARLSSYPGGPPGYPASVERTFQVTGSTADPLVRLRRTPNPPPSH